MGWSKMFNFQVSVLGQMCSILCLFGKKILRSYLKSKMAARDLEQ